MSDDANSAMVPGVEPWLPINCNMAFCRTILLAGMISLALPAQACLRLDGTTKQQYMDFANADTNSSRAVWVKLIGPTGTHILATGIILDSTDVLLPVHEYYAGGVTNTIFLIGNGPNCNTNPGQIVTPVSWVVSPDYDQYNTFVSTDEMVVHVSPGFTNVTDINISSAQVGIVYSGMGFSMDGTPSTGVTGNQDREKFNANCSQFGLNGVTVVSTNYGLTQFSDASRIQFNGNGTSGNSGSPEFDPNGNVAMMMTGGSLPSDGVEGFTIAYRLDQNLPFLYGNMHPTLNSSVQGTNLVLNWNGPFTLQAASAVTGPFWDVSGASSPYTNSMTLPQQFFRLTYHAPTNSPAALGISVQAASSQPSVDLVTPGATSTLLNFPTDAW